MNDPKGGMAKVTCPTFEAMGQIPVFHRTYFLLVLFPMTLSDDNPDFTTVLPIWLHNETKGGKDGF